MANRLTALQEQGQGVWLDYIRRNMLQSGELRGLIENDGLRGMTANPTIFQQAIAAGNDYDESVSRLIRAGADPIDIYEAVAVEDIQAAADQFTPVYESTNGADGYVSLEVAPSLARNTEGTIDEARRLWKMVGRPNLMIKVPGTKEGVPAIKLLLSEGINVNVTLLFSLEAYETVAWAYVEALEERAAKGEPVDRIASVASFFVSRIDTLVDSLLDAKLANIPSPSGRDTIERLKGKAAIANAKLAYESFGKIFGGDRFAALKAKGARVQRPLWASTSVKNPAYSDLMYVEALVGPDTVDTMPRDTLEAFRDHGTAARTVDQGLDDARQTMKTLAEVGIDFKKVTDQVETEGVEKFVASFDDLVAGIESKRAALVASGTRA